MSFDTPTGAPEVAGEAPPPAAMAPLPPHSLKARVIRNIASNWFGFAADSAVAFLLTPFLIHRLGMEIYGVWILIGALAGYLGMLDFGLRGSVGRFVAFHRGRGDREAILNTINTAVFSLVALGAIGFCIVAVTALNLEHLFEIPPEHLGQARWALLLVGMQLGAALPLCAFDGILWGHERFDLMNLV